MIFTEEGHTYQLGERDFTSVSKVLHSLEKPKNWKAIAKKYATKVGKTTEQVEAMWKEENEKSIIRGKEYHSRKQNQLIIAGFAQRRNVECTVKYYLPSGGKLHQPDFRLEDSTIYTELMLWDEDSGISGTADEVEVINNTIYVNDHKTNKEIKKEGFYVHNVGKEKLLAPVNHLDDCNWNKYCLQLSLYMYMLWKRNKHLKIGTLTLNHVEFDKDGYVVRVTPMNVPYLRKEVKDVIEWWKTKEPEHAS